MFFMFILRRHRDATWTDTLCPFETRFRSLREVATSQVSRAALPRHLLGQRCGVLAGSPAFDAERIPLGPRALCRAMRDASQTLQVPYEARLLLYRIFDRQVMAGYSRVLERLDDAMEIGRAHV